MFERIAFPRSSAVSSEAFVRWHSRVQWALAFATLAGFAAFLALILTKPFLLGSDSAHHYAHVWYVSDQIFHHLRLPLHFQYLESGKALTFPYGIVPYIATAIPYAVLGDWSVTASLVLCVILYGYGATRARPVLRDPRLLALVYLNTFLIEGIVSFQFAFLWSIVFFFFCVEAIDKRLWAHASIWAVIAVTTHLIAGPIAVAVYALYAFVRRPRDVVQLGSAMGIAALVCLPYLLYAHSTPAVSSTRVSYIIGTIKYMMRFRGTIIVLPFIVAALARYLKPMFVPALLAIGLVFGFRLWHGHVNIFGLNHNSQPFYEEFINSPQFDRSLTYRVLEPNDQQDGAYQLIKHGAVLGQEFFGESEFRRWWYSLDMYSCFLGAKNIDVVLFERDYPWKFNQNEQWPLMEFVKQGKAKIYYADPEGRFVAFDVRGAKMPNAKLSDCGF